MKPKVTLLSWTKDPVQTLSDLWWASKTEDPLDEVRARTPDRELFRRIVAQKIPVSEALDFVFMLEGVSVSFREQMVRHRIGTKVGQRVGADIVPDLADSSWWSQSMRIQDMGNFADAGMYRVPDTLAGKQVPMGNQGVMPAEEAYAQTMREIQGMYNRLVRAGVPMEDARDLIPLGAQHRISWKINLAALYHVIGKRSCWILQAGLWHPIISGMISELVEKVDPIFQDLAMPPCAKYEVETVTIRGEPAGGDWCFSDCAYHEENIRRVDGSDALPVCPLYAEQVGLDLSTASDVPMLPEMHERAKDYAKFWGRDPYTFKPLKK
jgi:hypothetical protein